MNNNGIVTPPSVLLEFTRKWQLNLCDGNACAAELLSLFERQYAYQLSIKFNTDDSFDFESSLKNFKNQYRSEAIVLAKKLLINKGIISILSVSNISSLNQSIYVFHPEVCNAWLEANNNNNGRTGSNNNNYNPDNQGQGKIDEEGAQTKPPTLSGPQHNISADREKFNTLLKKQINTAEIIYKHDPNFLKKENSIENNL